MCVQFQVHRGKLIVNGRRIELRRIRRNLPAQCACYVRSSTASSRVTSSCFVSQISSNKWRVSRYFLFWHFLLLAAFRCTRRFYEYAAEHLAFLFAVLPLYLRIRLALVILLASTFCFTNRVGCSRHWTIKFFSVAHYSRFKMFFHDSKT